MPALTTWPSVTSPFILERKFIHFVPSVWESNSQPVLTSLQEDYRHGCEWDITNASTHIVEEEGGFIIIQINIYLTRKLVFSSYILTLPCIFLAFLTLVVFCLPPERPDRTGLGKYSSLFCSWECFGCFIVFEHQSLYII